MSDVRAIRPSEEAPSRTAEVLIAPIGAPNPLAAARTRVPEVWLEAGPPGPVRLEWRWPSTAELSPPLSEAFWGFLDLARASDEDILRFAQRYGPLRIPDRGPNGTASGGAVVGRERYWESPGDSSRESQSTDRPDWEPVSAWRFHVRRLGARLSLLADVQNDTPTRPEDWDEATLTVPATTPPSELDDAFRTPPSTLMDVKSAVMARVVSGDLGGEGLSERHLLARILNDPADLARSSLRFAVGWDEHGRRRGEVALMASRWWDPTPSQTPPGWLVDDLYEAITFALTVMADFTNVARCDVYHRIYLIPDGVKRPRFDRQKFCSEACRTEARRITRRESEKRRYARRQGASGGAVTVDKSSLGDRPEKSKEGAAQ